MSRTFRKKRSFVIASAAPCDTRTGELGTKFADESCQEIHPGRGFCGEYFQLGMKIFKK